MKVVAHVFVFLVAVAGGFAVGLPGMVERAAERVEQRLEQALDVDIEVADGDWTFGGEVTLKGVEVRPRSSPPDEPPLLAARELRIEADVSLSRRRIKLLRVELHGGRAWIVRRPDGSDNVRQALTGLRKLLTVAEPGGSHERGGGLGSYLERTIPRFVASDLEVTAHLGKDRPAEIVLPSRVVLRGGSLQVHNASLVKEAPRLEVAVRFEDSSLDPGYGFNVDATLPLAGGETPWQLRFDRPARVLIGTSERARVLSVGAVAWAGRAKEPLEIEDLALSVPLNTQQQAGSAPVDAALSARRLRVTLAESTPVDSLRELLRNSRQPDALRTFLERLPKIEVIDPTVVFERTQQGHSFSDLVDSGDGEASEPVAEPPPQLGPERALGVMMEAARAASQRLTRGSRRARSGQRFRNFLVRGFKRLEQSVGRLSSGVVELAKRVPFRHLVVKGGHFDWRDSRPPSPDELRVRERLDNFRLEATRDAELVKFESTFEMPRRGDRPSRNLLEGRVHLVTGDSQLRARVEHLGLHPYRQALPKSFPIRPETALRDTELTLIWSPASNLARLEGKLGLQGAAFHYPALSREPLTGIDLVLDFAMQLDRERKTMVLSKSKMLLGKTHTEIRGDVAKYDTAPKLTGALRVHRTRCQEVFDSLPTGLLPLLEGLRVAGTFGWFLDFSLDTADMDTLDYHSYPELHGFRVVDMGRRLNLNAVRGTFLHRIEEADGTRRELLVGPGAPNWVALSQITPYMVKVVTTTEDGRFFRHKGFSPNAIKRSLVANLKRGDFIRGASTITQQLVKNLFLGREKTISRKLQEMFITSQIETALSKDQIMELYLNVIEWGPGIYGIKRASEHYFGKHPGELSALEAVFLGSLIPSPRRYYYQFKRGEVTDEWRRHLRWILSVMVERGKLTPEEYEAAAPYSPLFRGQEPPPPPEPTAAAPLVPGAK